MRIRKGHARMPLPTDRRPSSLLPPCGQHTLDDDAQDSCSRIRVRGLLDQHGIPSVPLLPDAPRSGPCGQPVDNAGR